MLWDLRSTVEVVLALFFAVVLPAMVYFGFLAVGAVLVSVLASVVLGPLSRQFRSVASFLEYLAPTGDGSGSTHRFVAWRPRVVVAVFVYAALVVVVALPAVVGAELALSRLPGVTDALLGVAVDDVAMTGYPVWLTVLEVPVVVLLYRLSGASADGPSVARAAAEWGVTLLGLNVLVVVGAWGATVGMVPVLELFFSLVS